MKVNLQNNFYNDSTNFSGLRLFNAQLPRLPKNGQKIPCFISEMTKEDGNYFLSTQYVWDGTHFGNYILKHFLEKVYEFNPIKTDSKWQDKTRYFMVEQPGAKDKSKRIKALAQIYEGNEDIEIKYLQSLRESNYGTNTSGAGSVLMYLATKLAQKLDKKGIALIPSNGAYDFYSAIGLRDNIKEVKCIFGLPANEFPKFQQKLERKYSILPEFQFEDFSEPRIFIEG